MKTKPNPVFTGIAVNHGVRVTLTCKSDEGADVRINLPYADAFKMATDVLTLLLTASVPKRGKGN